MGRITPRLTFTLCVLLGINTMNFFDRQILAVVQEKIKFEWDLSDRALGVLGTAFILLYAVVGLPLGRLADVGVRKWILAAGVGLWSLMTLGSGFAWGFWSLFALRLGVGVGEASCAPSANSLLGDLFPPDRRARALSVFMIGLPLGLALSFLVGGTVAQRLGWREAFFIAGLPGLALAAAALFIFEPARGAFAPRASSPTERLPYWAGVRCVLGLPTMWWIILSGALHNFNMYALGQFVASYLKRYHAVNVEVAGQISGLVYGCGAAGIFAAGWLGDRAWRRGPSGRMHVAWACAALAVPCLLLALAVPAGEVWLCAVWLLPACLLLYAYYGTIYATIHDIIEPTLRGTAMAVYFCGMYLLGAMLGPVVTGWLSDYFALRAATADAPLRLVEMTASTVGLLGSPGGEGSLLAATSLFPGRADFVIVSDWHKAVGLHDAMYLLPVLEALLVMVLFAASRTVKGDYLSCQKRMGVAAGTIE
jgi:MFS family permease